MFTHANKQYENAYFKRARPIISLPQTFDFVDLKVYKRNS